MPRSISTSSPPASTSIIDGPANSVYEVNMISPPRGPENPHGNAFRTEATLLASEAQAKRRVNSAQPAFWRIVNPTRKNRLGQPVAYRLVPGENAPPFAPARRRRAEAGGLRGAQPLGHSLSPQERYAAGDYPNQHPAGDGLPVWTAADRTVNDTDLVVWYVFGHTHVPRPEDWPVMPVARTRLLAQARRLLRTQPGARCAAADGLRRRDRWLNHDSSM